jgi:5,10-methylenetetrahydromethanopterin reductase
MAVTSEGRVALYLQDKHPIREGMAYVQLAEEQGFEAVWQAESRLVREATVPMAAFAAVTERIAVGSGVVNNWTRNVGLLAATFSTLDDLAPGRVKLGIGAWWDPLAAKVGITRTKPLKAMRETVEATRRLLAMERVTYAGEFVHLDDVEIDIVHGDRSPKQVPIYIGATAMKMMELAGEIGDGVLLNYLVGPGYNQEAMEHLAIGAERAGRTVDEIDRPQLVVCSLDDDRSHPVPRTAAAHHEGERRRARAPRGDRRDPDLARHRRADRGGDAPRPRRGRAADHRLRDARRVPREGARVRRPRVHVPGALPARGRRPRHDPRLCQRTVLKGRVRWRPR